MLINGLRLPDSFVSMLRSGKFNRPVGCWELKKSVDAYGNPLETELAEVFVTQSEITAATLELPDHFVADGDYGDDQFAGESGLIPDITDFTKIVHFANSADGAPFCFDFREREDAPNVIWWDDANWRRVAPDFDTFINLFNFDEESSSEGS